MNIQLESPLDMHLHLRDGAMLELVGPLSAAMFAGAVIMPNLVPPVASVTAARAYRERILAARPEGSDFTPLMTCYLTDATIQKLIERGFRDGIYHDDAESEDIFPDQEEDPAERFNPRRVIP